MSYFSNYLLYFPKTGYVNVLIVDRQKKFNHCALNIIDNSRTGWCGKE